MARRKLWRALQFAAGVVLVGLAVRAVVVNWGSLRAQPITWQFSAGWITASVLVVFASYAVLIEAWRRVVLSMGEQLGFVPAARIWFLASLGKYIPGKVWAVAGAAVLAQRAGVDPSVAVAGAIVLQALAVASGAVVVAATARDTLEAVGQGAGLLAGVVAILSVTGVVLLTSRAFLERVNRSLPSSWPRLRAIPLLTVGVAFMANVLAWVGYGVTLLLLTRGLLPGVTLGLGQAVGVFTCSYIVGFIALFAPGGLGPRESVFLLMLAGDLGLKPAAALAVASRLLLTCTEVLPAIPLLLKRSAPTPTSVREI